MLSISKGRDPVLSGRAKKPSRKPNETRKRERARERERKLNGLVRDMSNISESSLFVSGWVLGLRVASRNRVNKTN